MNSSEWKRAKLGESCDILTGFPFKSKDFNVEGKGIKLVRGKNVSKRFLRWGDDTRWWSDLTPEIEKYLLKEDDVLIGMDGSLVGKNYVRVLKNELPLLLVQRVACIRAKKDNNQKFIYYKIANNNFENYIDFVKTGTTIPHISGSQLADYMIDLPPFNEQEIIADTLSCLDDKIELNNRINKNLEEMAQVVFKSWFVDFEAFQDGQFVDSELGRIPKGWRVGTIGELISDTLGGDWGKEMPQGNYSEEVVCIRGADIPEIASGKKGKPPIRYILQKNLEKKRLSEWQIIIEISGGSPTQSTGRTALITQELLDFAGRPLVCTNFCRALSMKKEYYATFVYAMLQYLYNKAVLFLYENGTTGIKNLDTNNLFNKHLIVLPDDESMLRYKEIFDTIINLIYQNGAEIDKLATIRDALLPKLMSGEIRIPLEEV